MINNEILNFVQTAARNTPAPSKFKNTFDNVVKRASIQGTIKQRLDNQEQVLENQKQIQRQAVEAQRQALEAQRQVPEPEIQAAQEGGPIENAETDLEAMLGPMGVIDDSDGAPGPSLGGEGVADDLTMEVPEGSYILNSDGVSLIGISDINKVIRDAYTIAAALGQELPADYDPQNKVPIRISNGEAVIPAPLVGVIGLDRLERWNEKGLEVRRQREEAEKAQAETQAAQPVTEAPPVQPMQAQMSGMMGFKDGDEVEDDRDLATRIADFLGLGTLWRAGEITEDSLKQKALDILDPKNIPSFKDGGPPIPKRRPMSFWEKVAKEVRDTPENVMNWIYGKLESDEEEKEKKYGVGIPYKREDIEDAIDKVSRVLREGDDEYQELTKIFLTEIANAESSYGQDKTTNKKDSRIVGPWQIGMKDTQAYAEIKRRLDPNSNMYRKQLRANLDKFIATDWGKDIDWLNLTDKDMMNPLINAAIARLYISTMDEDAIPNTKRGRAELWDRIYNTTEDPSDADYYINKNMWIPEQKPNID